VRVCHVVSGNLRGGAARGALWLHRALLSAGCDSVLVTGDATGSEGTPSIVEVGWPIPIPKRVRLRIAWQRDQAPLRAYPLRMRHIFSTGLTGHSLQRLLPVVDADIVHLHWINGGFIDIRSLSRVAQPVAWTLRDLWPMTGGCHYPSVVQCDRFTDACGRCPHLRSATDRDLSSTNLAAKRDCLPSRLTCIAPCRWVRDEAARSSLLRARTVRVIPNCVDTDCFAPVPMGQARSELGLPQDVPIVLTGAGNAGDPYKGFDLFLEAAANFPSNALIAAFGVVPEHAIRGSPQTWKLFGRIDDDQKLRRVYAAANVFVAPSRVETFAKTVVEAQACGTPVVAFGATGPRDIINHLSDGWLALPFEAGGLSEGIRWCLRYPDPPGLREAARNNAVSRFSRLVVARQHMVLYQQMLDGRG
jgi:glycosyltransferase involved in cell wall biosynthesis